MDKEEREALELTKKDLLNKIKSGRRVDLPRRRPEDMNQVVATIVDGEPSPVKPK